MNSSEDDAFMAELKLEFKIALKKNLLEFQSLYKEEKYADIARIAHDIKGNAGLFELTKGSEIAAALQQSAQAREAEKTRSLIEELTAYLKAAGMID
jgi:HPt (histidine-containing phosphotransfer) domain-containing protein